MSKVQFDWSHVIKTVRAFVVQNVATDDATKDYIKIMMRETDTFHDYESMDGLHFDLNQDSDKLDLDHIYDALYTAIENMFGEIKAHFNDPWNFAPGYAKPEIAVPYAFDMPEEQIAELLKTAAPEVFAIATAKRT